MHVLIGKRFVGGFLPYHRGPGDVRIGVDMWLTVAPVSGIYFVRPFDWRIVANYVREIGVRAVVHKVLSRHAERARNAKFVSIGHGRIIASDQSTHRIGEAVDFIACRHPAALDELVVPAAFARPCAARQRVPVAFDTVCHGVLPTGDLSLVGLVDAVAGWDADSGAPLPHVDWLAVQTALARYAQSDSGMRAHRLPTAALQQDRSLTVIGPEFRTATLFGYGNYAKTVILPNLPPSIRIDRIHEVDPLQIPRRHRGVTWSTNPRRDPADPNRIAFIAGYHHTHADLAAATLQRGDTAVVEKPLVVNRAQQTDLMVAMTSGAGRLFACFHKRYSPFNRLALDDLACSRGAPISYHAIVYEVPLPARHWYRWPNSHSAIVSNGCHWLDHFLWLNDYSPYRRFALDRALDGSFNISVELANGAYLTLVLTHRGSERIGMREYVELRTPERTIRIIDNGDYTAESSRRRLRHCRMNKMQSYGRMYERIGQAIVRDDPGDSLASVDVGCRLMLDLDDAVSSRVVTPS